MAHTAPTDRQTPSDQQLCLLDRWFPQYRLAQDHSWGLVERAVWQIEHAGDHYVVKAGGADDHHIGREIEAHLHWLAPWTSLGRAPQLVHHDRDANLLVTRWQPGDLVRDVDAVDDPDTYVQAGHLLALLHTQLGEQDPDYEVRANRRSLDWLDQPHRIAADTVQTLRALLRSWPTDPVVVVPTHGDWQPRNWLVHDAVVSVIDFGRAALRPAMTDFTRLAAQEFRREPVLEEAFLSGYGSDPREPAAWQRERVREAIGTAVWAHQVGDEAFERQGHRMISDELSRLA